MTPAVSTALLAGQQPLLSFFRCTEYFGIKGRELGVKIGG
jgi:hypothetical protein